MKPHYCLLCQKEHTSFAWKLKNWEVDGELVNGWACEKWFKPTYHEFTSSEIREGRKRFRDDLVQPHREGVVSKEFVEKYPQQAKARFTPKEIKKAKNVWGPNMRDLF